MGSEEKGDVEDKTNGSARRREKRKDQPCSEQKMKEHTKGTLGTNQKSSKPNVGGNRSKSRNWRSELLLLEGRVSEMSNGSEDISKPCSKERVAVL